MEPHHLSWSNHCKDSSPTTNPISFVAWQQAATQGLPWSDLVKKTIPLHHHPPPVYKCLHFLHWNQFLTTDQASRPSIVIFNELFKPGSDLWLWFTLTKKNNLLLTGKTDGGGDEKRHNGVSLQRFLAFKHKSSIVSLCIDDTLLLLNAFYFLVTPNSAACHWLSIVLLSASFSLFPSFPFTLLLFSFHVTLLLLSQTLVHMVHQTQAK